MKDLYGNVCYEEIEDLLKEQEIKLKSIIGRKITDIIAYSDEEFTSWSQPIIFIIEDTSLLVEVYDLEKLVLKWDYNLENDYFIDEVKWGNKKDSFRKLINSKIIKIDIIEFHRKLETIYTKDNENKINKINYYKNLIGIGIHTETGYIEIYNGIDEANITFEYLERGDLKRTMII